MTNLWDKIMVTRRWEVVDDLGVYHIRTDVFDDGRQFYVAEDVGKEIAEHIVNQHNDSLEAARD